MIEWKGYKWLQQERWGQIHIDKPHWWYDPESSFIDDDDRLNLLTRKKVKYFDDFGISSTIGVGLVSCTESFKFGRFEIEAKLPYGKNLWPAFWMWSFDSWPPEIDILEGYSNNNSNFFKLRLGKPLGFWNIQTNVHYRRNYDNKTIGSKTHYFGFKDPTKNFIKYSLDWTRESLKFYYDGRLVRKMDDKKIMDQINKTNMNVVINNGVTNKVDLQTPPNSRFIIKDFKWEAVEER